MQTRATATAHRTAYGDGGQPTYNAVQFMRHAWPHALASMDAFTGWQNANEDALGNAPAAPDTVMLAALSDETKQAHEVAMNGGLPISRDGIYPALVWQVVMG